MRTIFKQWELKTLLRLAMKNLPEGPAKGNLLLKIVGMIKKLETVNDGPGITCADYEVVFSYSHDQRKYDAFIRQGKAVYDISEITLDIHMKNGGNLYLPIKEVDND